MLVDRSLGIVFLGLAAWFVLASPPASIPLPSVSATSSMTQIETGPRRTAVGVPPATMVGGYSHTCNDCHRLFQSPPVAERSLVQHVAIKLNHGMNNRCFNCHDIMDRERLVLADGSTISFAHTPRLCAQCHGTVFRDWERGMHGKTLGSWLALSGRQRRLACNECHDPHAPAYEPIQPLPGPNTLRMGDQGRKHEHRGPHMPLRRWSAPPEQAPHWNSADSDREEAPL